MTVNRFWMNHFCLEDVRYAQQPCLDVKRWTRGCPMIDVEAHEPRRESRAEPAPLEPNKDQLSCVKVV